MERKKHRFLYIILLLLLAALLAAGWYLYSQLQGRETAKKTGDKLYAEGQYGEAMEAYAQLMEDITPLRYTPLGKELPQAGAEGVLSCVDALLETEDGPRYLMEQNVFETVPDHATHPDAPVAFLREALDQRALFARAVLVNEEGDLKEALALVKASGLTSPRALALIDELTDTLNRQEILLFALKAREEGRLEEALALVKESGLQPELIDEIQHQITDENDRKLIDQAWEAMEAKAPQRAMDILSGLSNNNIRRTMKRVLTDARKDMIQELRTKYADKVLAGAWYSLVLGDEPKLTGDRRYEDLKKVFTPEDRVVSGLFSLIRLTDGRVELLGDTLGATKVVEEITDAKDAALGLNHGLVLHRNGTVTHLGARQYGRDAAEEWRGIIQVAAGAFHSVGLTRRGMVVAAGLNLDSQCRVSGWTNVVAVDAGLRHTVALLKSGRVVATGDNSFGQCDVSGWRDVIEIRCGGNFTVGLTSDYRLLATGDNGCGQCNVSDWQEVMAFDAGLWHTVALLSDGTIVTAGTNDHDQCALEGVSLFPAEEKAQRTAPVFGSETELVYIGDPKDGPWFYCSGEGSVIIAFDVDTGKMKATRADLICTYGHPPVGILSGGGDEPQRSVSASKLAKQNKAVFALTGDYFTFGYNADGLQIRRGHVFKEKKDEVGFGFFLDGSMRIIDPYEITAEELLAQGVNDSWVFGPTLIEDGLALDIHKHPLAYNDVTMRTVMASICPYHHIGAAYGSCTLAQVVENLLDYGCTIAYNLDGGRSSMMVFLGETVNRSAFLGGGWRGLQDMVGFLASDLVPEP